ncbi:MAG: hypothetical protein M3N07_07225, partial [Pseudomonadota bacterium]|nr:hypothetical protein [Pseudomonadota bacterium]
PIIHEHGGHVDKFVGDGLLAVFGAPRRQPDHADQALAAALAIAGVAAASQLSATHFEINRLLGDLWVETDAIWRSHLGQRPNEDFVTPVGPLFYGVYRLLSLLEAPSLHLMVHANLLVGAAAALLAFFVARRAASTEAVVLLMLAAFLAAASGRAIGTPLTAQSVEYIVPYNRWSWAIAIPCVFGLLVRHRGVAMVPFALVGLGLAALFFLKLSYFVALAGLAAGAFLLDALECEARPALAPRAAALAGSLALFLALGAAVWSIGAYLADVRMVAAANYVSFRLVKFAMQLPEAALMFGLALLVHHLASGFGRLHRLDAARLLLVVGSGAAIMSQNHEANEAPLYLAGLILAYVLGRSRAGEAAAAGERAAGASFWLTFLLLLVPASADAGTAAMARLRAAAKPLPPIAAFAGTPLADLRSVDREEIGRVIDGLALLRRAGHSGETVLPFTMGNPFPALTGTRSPLGAQAIWYYGRTFSERHRPPAERALGDADFLLIARDDLTSQWMWRVYEPAIRAQYRPVGESRHWVAWRRAEQAAERARG